MEFSVCSLSIQEPTSGTASEPRQLSKASQGSQALRSTQGGKSSEVLSATELRVQLAQKEQELARAKEALQGK